MGAWADARQDYDTETTPAQRRAQDKILMRLVSFFWLIGAVLLVSMGHWRVALILPAAWVAILVYCRMSKGYWPW